MSKFSKSIIIAILAVFLTVGGLRAVDFTSYKMSFDTARYHLIYNAFVTAVQTEITALSNLITNWVGTVNSLTLIETAPTYVDNHTFRLAGDYTALLTAGKRLVADCGADGLQPNTVATCTYAAPNSTVVVNTTNLTNNLAAVSYYATRNGLNTYGSGHIVAGEFGPPSWANLQAAVNLANSSGAPLLITPGTWPLADHLAITAPVSLVPGAIITNAGATTKNLNINGPFEAGLYQVFAFSGTGKVLPRTGVVRELYSEWWGAIGDGYVDDSVPFEAFCIAIGNSGIAGKLQSKTYKVNTQTAVTLTTNQCFTMYGNGGSSILDFTGMTRTGTAGLYINGVAAVAPASGNVVRLSNFKMYDNCTTFIPGTNTRDNLRVASVGQTILSEIISLGAPQTGIFVDNTTSVSLQSCDCSWNMYAGAMIAGTSSGATIFGGKYNYNGPRGSRTGGLGYATDDDLTTGRGYGLIVDAISSKIYGPDIIGNDRYGIDVRGATNHVLIDGAYIYLTGYVGIYAHNYTNGGGVINTLKIAGTTIDTVLQDTRLGGVCGIGIETGATRYGSTWSAFNEIDINAIIKNCDGEAIWIDNHVISAGVSSVKKVKISGQITSAVKNGTNPILIGSEDTSNYLLDYLNINNLQIEYDQSAGGAGAFIKLLRAGIFTLNGCQFNLTGGSVPYAISDYSVGTSIIIGNSVNTGGIYANPTVSIGNIPEYLLSGSGSPIGVVTPKYVRQEYWDTGGHWYKAHGLTNTSWTALN